VKISSQLNGHRMHNMTPKYITLRVQLNKLGQLVGRHYTPRQALGVG